MARALNVQGMNNPLWNENTSVGAVVLTGGFDQVTITGYYLIISNVGANNVFVGPSDSVPGVLLQPGGTFETAAKAGSNLYVQGTATQPVTVTQYA